MSSEENITRGGLSGKMEGYQPVPPQSVWDGVASAIQERQSRRKLFILLGAAAGLALAITVGIALFSDAGQPGIVMYDEGLEAPAATGRDGISSMGAGPAGDTGEVPDPAAGAAFKTPEPPGAGPASGTGKPPSRLEEKVIIAFRDVQDEKPEEGERLAENDHLIIEPDGQALAGGKDIQQPLANNNRGQVVNEDSLVKLLHRDAAEAFNVESPEPETLEPEKREKGKWQLGAVLSPLISYRDVASVDEAQNMSVNQSESARLTYSGGMQVTYLHNDRLAIQTGVQYNKMGVNIGSYSSFKSGWFQSELDMIATPSRSESVVGISNSMGTVVSADNDLFVNSYAGTETLTDYHMLTPEEMMVGDASVEHFMQTFEYIEIPFNVRYKVLDRTFGLVLTGGFSTNLLVNNTVSAIAGDEVIAIGEVRDVRTFNYSGNAGVGVVYDIFENFSLSVEPRFRYYLNSINTANLPVTRPYSFGFYTGVNYRF